MRALLLVTLAMLPSAASGQVVPNAEYRTLVTPHFRVHYTPELDSLARRAAVSAERAWGRLARELAPPRGPVDLVVADNVDYSNGYATTFPSNRIVVYAAPPIEGALRNYGDWMDLVVTHELVHVFHLDRSRGLWRLGQRIFGRNPALFPNAYAPAWLTEGLAVYYETRLTGSGRLAGTAHRVQALASASGGASPRLDQLSGATPAFPGGSSAYVWGSLAVEQLAARGDSAAVRRFIDRSAGALIPFRLNHVARAAFGASFSDAWAMWRDSLGTVARTLHTDSSWQVIGPPAWDAAAPRWRADGLAAHWPASFARDVPALWSADADGRLRRGARRNSLDVNAPRAGGGVVFGQLEFVDAFRVRGDLWIEDVGGARRRLTHGARLAQPDVRADGAIVAVQLVRGTSRLVRLTEQDVAIVPITAAHPDTQWTEPRWGGAGGRELAAVRRVRGGRAEVVRLDTLGVATMLLASDRVEASPAWSPDGCTLWSVSDRTGVPQPIITAAACGASAIAGPVRALVGVAPNTVGVVSLDARRGGAAGPDETPRLVAVAIGARGYRLLVRPEGAPPASDTVVAVGDSLDVARVALSDTGGSGAARVASRAYSPLRTLVPTWWLPLLGTTGEGTRTLGAYSSGSDVVGRHVWSAQLAVPLRRAAEMEGALTWRWRGLGQPALDLALVQEWDATRVLQTAPSGETTVIGRASRATRTVSLGASLIRPRIYTNASLSAGAEFEWLEPVRVDPASLDGRLGSLAHRRLAFPGAYLSLALSALQRAPQAVSPEDGLAFATTLRQRWQGDAALDDARTAVAILRAYRSVPLPGYAKHVLATRLSAAWASDASLDRFGAGGISGSSLEVLPGVTVGDASRAFGVRGFPAGAQAGNRALGGALEYRAPLLLANRGLGLLPLYLARTGVTVFGEGASAWCDVPARVPVCASGPQPRAWMASVGGELWLDASASYDVPYRVRLGVALPVREPAIARSASVYLTFGAAF